MFSFFCEASVIEELISRQSVGRNEKKFKSTSCVELQNRCGHAKWRVSGHHKHERKTFSVKGFQFKFFPFIIFQEWWCIQHDIISFHVSFVWLLNGELHWKMKDKTWTCSKIKTTVFRFCSKFNQTLHQKIRALQNKATSRIFRSSMTRSSQFRVKE